MSVGFQAVQWNRRKLIYDGILLAGVALFIGTFMTVGALRNPSAASGQEVKLYLGFALAEALGIFSLLIAILLMFVL